MDARKEWVEGIIIDTLGRFLVKCGSLVLSEKESRSYKVWELFKYLLTNRQKHFAPDSILEALWPEKEYADNNNTLRVLAHRLRRIFENNLPPECAVDIAYSQGCYSLVLPPKCRLDTDEFERLLADAHRLFDCNCEAAIEAYIRAVSLYRGDYLPEIGANWIFPARNYYRHLYLNAIIELSVLLKNAGRFYELIEITEKALLIEPLEEELNICYMEALLAGGKAAQARKHYQYITSAFYKEIGVKPSAAMRNLYRIIKPDNGHSTSSGSEDPQKSFNGQEEKSGPLFCEPDYFHFSYKLEQRRTERLGLPLCVGLLTLSDDHFRLPPAGELHQLMEKVKTIISGSFRKGDLVSQWNNNQYILLFPGLDREQALKVLRRAAGRFNSEHRKDRFVLRISANPLLP